MLCVPHSLSRRGPALGAQAGEARLRRIVSEGGFGRFRRAAQTPFNLILEARAWLSSFKLPLDACLVGRRIIPREWHRGWPT